MNLRVKNQWFSIIWILIALVEWASWNRNISKYFFNLLLPIDAWVQARMRIEKLFTFNTHSHTAGELQLKHYWQYSDRVLQTPAIESFPRLGRWSTWISLLPIMTKLLQLLCAPDRENVFGCVCLKRDSHPPAPMHRSPFNRPAENSGYEWDWIGARELPQLLKVHLY